MTIEEVQKELERRKRIIATDLGKAVNNGCYLVERTAKQGMKTTVLDKSKTYTHGTVTHTASAEGEYPAVDTGRLIQSITHDVNIEDGVVVGRVGTSVKYGAMLENGTSKMAPRLWLKPSYEKSSEKIKELIMSAVKGEDVEISIGTE